MTSEASAITPSSVGPELRLPSYPWRFAHLAALWAFGVSQPVFSMLKGNPEFLVVRGSSRADVLVFAFALAFLPPLVAVIAEWVLGLVSAMLSRVLHVLAVWAFTLLAVLQIVRLREPESAAFLFLALLPAMALTLAYLRWNAIRTVLSLSLALPLLGTLLFVATVPLAAADGEAAQVTVRRPTPIVYVVLDELPTSSLLVPDGSLDARRYPGFARLARDGVWYRNATSVHEFTTQAVPALLTGQNPVKNELPTLTDHPENLFTLLGERYSFKVIEPVSRLCPGRYCPEAHVQLPWRDRFRGLIYDAGVGYLYRILPADLRGGLPPIGDRWGGFGQGSAGTRERLAGALDVVDVNLALEREDHRPRSGLDRLLRGIRRGEQPSTLHFAHLHLPHAPFRLLPSGREYGNAENIDGILDDAFNNWSDSGWLVDQALQRHLLQVGYTDRIVRQLIARLEETDVYDDALVIVTADHGASFEPGGSRRYVTPRNVADIASVPLFVKYPRGSRHGEIDMRDARTTDVLPTIADVLGVALPWRVDGRSLLRPPVTRRVSVGRRVGGAVVADADDVARHVMATARRNASLFGTGTASLYRIGSNRSLLGRMVESVPTTVASGAHVEFEGEQLYANVSLRSGFVPARVVGEVSGRPLAPGSPLAIAVNGRVSATTRTFLQNGASRFAAMVPETAFRSGANRIDVFGVQTSGGRIRLSRYGGTVGGIAAFALTADGNHLVTPEGARVDLSPGRLQGHVESVTREGSVVRLRGWAADVVGKARVDRVLLFSGRRLVFESDTRVYRWDIKGVSGVRGLERVGFAMEMPGRDVTVPRLRLIAVRGSVASEIAWPESLETIRSSSLRPCDDPSAMQSGCEMRAQADPSHRTE